jgi:acetyltransferase
MHKSTYLRALLAPTSVALVGASGRPGSMGRILFENLIGGGFAGPLYAVNPNHRRVLARRSYASVAAIKKPIDLALIATPSAAVPGVVEDAARAGAKAAVIMSVEPREDGEAKRWRAALERTASERGIRLLGPYSFGVMRTGIGLNATLGSTPAESGRLALIAQSGAVCAAMLDFAASVHIGFSTVVEVGGAIDLGFGELLDALVVDPDTDGILLYAEAIGDARRFLSALRAAARTKPVVVLRAGRSMDPLPVDAPTPDAVFDAAMNRAGSVRVKTYAQLFAAARILAMHRMSRGDRLAIVSNGSGPGTLAADSAADRGIALSALSAATTKRLADVLPPNAGFRNPIDVRGDAPPERIAAAVEATLADPNADAVLVLHVPQPITGATDAARAVAVAAARATKPVLGAWLGAVDRREVTAALEAGGVANFYTPENAVEAFSFLAAYRRHQEWLLEVPASQPEPQAPHLDAIEHLRIDARTARRSVLTEMETHTLVSAFGLPVPATESADTLAEATAAGRRLGFPVTLRLAVDDSLPAPGSGVAAARVRDGRMLARAWAGLHEARADGIEREAVLVAREQVFDPVASVAIGVCTDAVFGPVITFGAECAGGGADVAVLLPPLNLRLARDFLRGLPKLTAFRSAAGFDEATDALAQVLVQVSALACAVPWVRTLALYPVKVGAGKVEIARARAAIDPSFDPGSRPYGHMAIHPYPVELVTDVTLRDGTRLHVRPIRPEDAALERAFVASLSDETRYFRFFYQLNELSPTMLARFTQVDYDREMALVAIDESEKDRAIVGVARYTMDPGRESAEFAIVVADAWQQRGVGRMLMDELVACSRARGLSRIQGSVLRSNRNMLRFTESLGFAAHDDPEDPELIDVVLELIPQRQRPRAEMETPRRRRLN